MKLIGELIDSVTNADSITEEQNYYLFCLKDFKRFIELILNPFLNLSLDQLDINNPKEIENTKKKWPNKYVPYTLSMYNFIYLIHLTLSKNNWNLSNIKSAKEHIGFYIYENEENEEKKPWFAWFGLLGKDNPNEFEYVLEFDEYKKTL